MSGTKHPSKSTERKDLGTARRWDEWRRQRGIQSLGGGPIGFWIVTNGGTKCVVKHWLRGPMSFATSAGGFTQPFDLATLRRVRREPPQQLVRLARRVRFAARPQYASARLKRASLKSESSVNARRNSGIDSSGRPPSERTTPRFATTTGLSGSTASAC